MGRIHALPALAALLMAPVDATAQPAVYVCTPAAQVVAVNGTTGAAAVIYTGSGTFDDCVLGPDGRLYVANDTQVLRFDPLHPTSTDEFVATLPTGARGLSFNVTTLYVSTAASGLWAFQGMSDAPQGGPFPSPAAPAFTLGAGQGVTFSIDGAMWLVSGSSVRQSPPSYTSSTPLATAGLTTPVGVGVETCGNLLVADGTSQTIKRYARDGTLLGAYLDFPAIGARRLVPKHFEIDASNRVYVVAETSADKNALIVRSGENLDGRDATSSCGSAASAITLAELNPSVIPGLLSSRAAGIAVGPTDHRITKTFSPESCGTKLYDFGYHTMKVTFEQCLTAFSLTISALESLPSDVTFDDNPAEFPTAPSAIRYSPLGGSVIQYRYDGPLPQPFVHFDTFSAQYGFFTQEAVGTPGVARAPGDNPTDPFMTNVSHAYWDVGALDAAAGDDRGNDFSKRVVFNSPLAVQGCTFGGFALPLGRGKPFQRPDTIPIGLTLNGEGCTGGSLMVSVAKLEEDGFVVQPVQSLSQADNVMESKRDGFYQYFLKTSAYAPGTYQITIWGNVTSPINEIVEIVDIQQ
jgi:hypothetical protein